MPKTSATSTIPSFQFDEYEIEKIRKALIHYGAYLNATNRDARPYEELADRLTGA